MFGSIILSAHVYIDDFDIKFFYYVHYSHATAALLKNTNSLMFKLSFLSPIVFYILLVNVYIILFKYSLSVSSANKALTVFIKKNNTGRSSMHFVNPALSNSPSLGAV